jgi:hypothetical protein
MVYCTLSNPITASKLGCPKGVVNGFFQDFFIIRAADSYQQPLYIKKGAMKRMKTFNSQQGETLSNRA